MLSPRLPASVEIVATSSVGYEHIDVEAARTRGLIVTNTPGVLTDATADMALLLILGACRRARDYIHIMEEGWRRKFDQSQMLGIDLRGRTLGIVGLGRIGQAVAARARAFGTLTILYTGRQRVRRLNWNKARAISPALTTCFRIARSCLCTRRRAPRPTP